MEEYFKDLLNSINNFNSYGNESVLSDTKEILSCLEKGMNSNLQLNPELLNSLVSFVYEIDSLISNYGVTFRIDKSGNNISEYDIHNKQVVIGDKDIAYGRSDIIIHEIGHAILENELNIDYSSENIKDMLDNSRARIISNNELVQIIMNIINQIMSMINLQGNTNFNLRESMIDYSSKNGSYVINGLTNKTKNRLQNKINMHKENTFDKLDFSSQQELLKEVISEDLKENQLLGTCGNLISVIDMIGAIFENDLTLIRLDNSIFKSVAHDTDYYSSDYPSLSIQELFAEFLQLSFNPNYKENLETLKILLGDEIYSYLKSNFDTVIQIPNIDFNRNI